MEQTPKHKTGDCEICKETTTIYYHIGAEEYLCINCYRAIEKMLSKLPTFKEVLKAF